MADKLTIKQEKYAQGLFAGLSQREAYKKAFPTSKAWKDETVDSKACILAKDEKVMARLDDLTAELRERNMVTVERTLEEIAHIAFDDIRNYLRFYQDPFTNQVAIEINDSATIDTRSIAEVSLSKKDGFKFKMYCKDVALYKLAQHLGLFTNETEQRLRIEKMQAELDKLKNPSDIDINVYVKALQESAKEVWKE